MKYVIKFSVKFFGILYRVTLQAIFNVIFNVAWLAYLACTCRLVDSIRARRSFKMQAEAGSDSGLMWIMRRGSYHLDGIGPFPWPTWTACTLVLIARNGKGNCQDFAHFAKWIGRLQGYRSRIHVYTTLPKFWLPHYIYEYKPGVFVSNTRMLAADDRDAAAAKLTTRKPWWI